MWSREVQLSQIILTDEEMMQKNKTKNVRLGLRKANSYAVGFAVRSKSTFQYVRMSFSPENVGNWSSSPQNDLEFSPRSIQSCFPVGSEKCWRWLPATGSLEKRKTALDGSWRKLQVILRRGLLIPNIFGAKPDANVLKATFSTDCKIQLQKSWPYTPLRPGIWFQFEFCYKYQTRVIFPATVVII